MKVEVILSPKIQAFILVS